MIAPEVLDALLGAGATAEMIVAAVKADLALSVAVVETRRAKDAERQRRHRLSRDVTVTGSDSVTEPLSPLAPPKVFPGPLSNTPPIPPIPHIILAQAKFALPGDIPAEPFADFDQMRKKIGAPMTDRARELAVAKLRRLRDEDGWPPGDVLNHCTMNSYRGIYPPSKDQKNGQQYRSNIGKSQAAYAMLGLRDDQAF